MSSLLLMRHGQARFGAAHYDLLTELGERQAVETGAHFARAGSGFDEVQIGPKRRHASTAAGVLGQLRHAPAPIISVALDEFAEATEIMQAAPDVCGVTAEGIAALPRVEQLRHYDTTIEAWMHGRVRLAGRPSAAAFRAEVARWLREVVARPVRSQRLLIVTSAGVVAAVVAEVLDVPVERMTQFTRVLRNASLTEIAFSAGRVSLVSFNGVAHLPAELATGM
ncbi:MAG TPA: histidine phosphatase family protein [Casimicrobiaceae bacterium]|nr:histidine phosphatase family protein [Casimicrobiaceae bacterium]